MPDDRTRQVTGSVCLHTPRIPIVRKLPYAQGLPIAAHEIPALAGIQTRVEGQAGTTY
jgi:hypothetical protein